MTNMNIISSTYKIAVFKTDQGWFDRDVPNVFYPTRRDARAARRLTKTGATTTVSVSKPQVKSNTLQDRAAARLRSMNVAEADIDRVIYLFGYNASVSYGHMRVAGATHEEALDVISLGFPDVSLSYGQKRQRGMNHTDALIIALDE